MSNSLPMRAHVRKQLMNSSFETISCASAKSCQHVAPISRSTQHKLALKRRSPTASCSSMLVTRGWMIWGKGIRPRLEPEASPPQLRIYLEEHRSSVCLKFVAMAESIAIVAKHCRRLATRQRCPHHFAYVTTACQQWRQHRICDAEDQVASIMKVL